MLLQFIDDKVILSNPDLRRVPINVAIDDKGNHYVVTLTPLNDIGNKHLLRIAEIMGYVPQKPLQLHT